MQAQRPVMGKLSPWLRQVVRAERHSAARGQGLSREQTARTAIAFVKTTADGEQSLSDHGCRSLARYGRLHIAAIPLDQLGAMTLDRRVLRIEASPSGHVLMDSMAVHLNATPAYAGISLPQAFTGRGVVVGVMDVGFDLTHPNFYSRDLKDYRIRRLWDHISQDTIGSPFPVGRDYTTKEALLALGHSRDGQDIAHGAHTLGIAAGSGYDSPYQGMAPEADICLVANAVSEDLPYIDPADLYKYTFATDALGFKYIFDYAQSVGQPCVASFSEGSMQDFWGYDQLYYEFLDSLVGPGRILVAAAGNEGYKTNWLHKERGRERAGSFLSAPDTTMMVTLKSPDAFTLRLVAYNGQQRDTLLIRPQEVCQKADSTLTVSLPSVSLLVEAYPSCYDAHDLCYDLTLTSSSGPLGLRPQLSIELLGADADVELWRVSGLLTTSQLNPQLADGYRHHCIHSPSSAPCVISVGATSYRDHVINIQGDSMAYWPGTGGRLVEFSSTGPTMDGRIKPDCVAPGNNIISSYNSFYLEQHPTANDNRWDVARFTFQGRTYAWNSNSGTSMSTPAVAGAIALWLQACPTLTPADVTGLLRRTCRHPEPGLDYPNNQYGHGEIDVYAGLLDILNTNAIADLPKHHTRARLHLAGRLLSIAWPEAIAAPQPLSIYSLGGQPVVSATLPAGQQRHSLSLPPLASGIYVVVLGQASTLIRIN